MLNLHLSSCILLTNERTKNASVQVNKTKRYLAIKKGEQHHYEIIKNICIRYFMNIGILQCDNLKPKLDSAHWF